MKKFLLIGTALAGAGGIAAADSVDVTLGAILEDVTFFGLKGYGAVDVSTVNLGRRSNYLLGTSFDLFGLTSRLNSKTVSTLIRPPPTTKTAILITGMRAQASTGTVLLLRLWQTAKATGRSGWDPPCMALVRKR